MLHHVNLSSNITFWAMSRAPTRVDNDQVPNMWAWVADMRPVRRCRHVKVGLFHLGLLFQRCFIRDLFDSKIWKQVFDSDFSLDRCTLQGYRLCCFSWFNASFRVSVHGAPGDQQCWVQNLGLILDVQILPSSYLGDKTDVTLFQNLGALIATLIHRHWTCSRSHEGWGFVPFLEAECQRPSRVNRISLLIGTWWLECSYGHLIWYGNLHFHAWFKGALIQPLIELLVWKPPTASTLNFHCSHFHHCNDLCRVLVSREGEVTLLGPVDIGPTGRVLWCLHIAFHIQMWWMEKVKRQRQENLQTY